MDSRLVERFKMIDSRLEDNKKILEFIEKFLDNNKDLRFCQALCALDLKSDENFYEEPQITLKRLKENEKSLKSL